MHKRKAQGALEYIVIIVAVLGIVAIVALFATGAFGVQKSGVSINACKQTASQCKVTHYTVPKDPCLQCEQSCNSSGIEVFNGAIKCCKLGQPENIYDGSPGCTGELPVCGDGIASGTEQCDGADDSLCGSGLCNGLCRCFTMSITSPGDSSGTSTTLAATTSENAYCYYGTASNPTTPMTVTGATTHSVILTNLPEGSNTYYVKCTNLLATATTLEQSKTWTAAVLHIEASQDSPEAGSYSNVYQTYTVNVLTSVQCYGGYCGATTGTLYFGEGTPLSTGSGTGNPVYTTNTNPQSCPSALDDGDGCAMTWNVVVIGTPGTEVVLYAGFESNPGETILTDNAESITILIQSNDNQLIVNSQNPSSGTIVIAQPSTLVPVSFRVSCIGMDCGYVNATVKYNKTGSEPNENISNARGATPFNVNTIPLVSNPFQCGHMCVWGTADDCIGLECTKTWQVNVTAPVGSKYALGIDFNSTNPSVTNKTNKFYVQTASSPWLNVTLKSPLISQAVLQNNLLTYNANATIRCMGGNCGTVSGALRYNITGTNPNTAVSTTSGATPFYILGVTNPISCGEMVTGQECKLNWTRVNATGSGTYALDIQFTSSNVSIMQNDTSNFLVTIGSNPWLSVSSAAAPTGVDRYVFKGYSFPMSAGVTCMAGSCMTVYGNLTYDSQQSYNIGTWKLDEGSGNLAYDHSGNNYRGFITGTPAWTAGKIGNALSLTGNYVDIYSRDGLAPSSLTVEMWVKTTASGGTLFNGSGYSLSLSSGKVMAAIAQVGGSVTVTSDATINDGSWHHVVMTCSSLIASIYVDGYSPNFITISPIYYSATQRMVTIGPVTAAIDEVRVYNKVLSLAEIINHYNGLYFMKDATAPEYSGTPLWANQNPQNEILLQGQSSTYSWTATATGNNGYYPLKAFFSSSVPASRPNQTSEMYKIIYNGPVELYYTEFLNSNDWTASGVITGYWKTGTTPYNGTTSAQAYYYGTTQYFSHVDSTSGYRNINVSLWFKTDPSSGSTFALQYTSDGSTWQSVYSNSGVVSAWKYVSVILPSGANNNPNFGIRLYHYGTSSVSYTYVDTLRITGYPNNFFNMKSVDMNGITDINLSNRYNTGISCNVGADGAGDYNVSLQYSADDGATWMDINETNTVSHLQYNATYGSNPRWNSVAGSYENREYFAIRAVDVSYNHKFRCKAAQGSWNSPAKVVYSPISSMNINFGGELYYTDFLNLNGWAVTGVITGYWRIGTTPYNGTTSVQAYYFGTEQYVSHFESTEGVNDLRVTLWFRTAVGYSSSFAVQYTLDGGATWQTAYSYAGISSSWTPVSVILPSGASKNPNFGIRLYHYGYSSTSYTYVDTLRILGTAS